MTTIFSRERLRLVLDTIEGYGYRLQFLGIPMTQEEQCAFIQQYGSRLELLLEQQREELEVQRREIDEKLRRLEFLHDCSKVCRSARLVVSLDRPYTSEELGHFRILLQVVDRYERPHPSLYLGARDSNAVWHSGDQKSLLCGYRALAWSRNPDHKIQDTRMGMTGCRGDRIEAWGHIHKLGSFPTLGSFDHTTIRVFATGPLLDALSHIAFAVNDYLLIGVPREHIASSEELFGREPAEPEWLECLQDEERLVAWTELDIRGPDADLPQSNTLPPFAQRRELPWGIDFEAYTPVKLGSTLGGLSQLRPARPQVRHHLP